MIFDGYLDKPATIHAAIVARSWRLCVVYKCLYMVSDMLSVFGFLLMFFFFFFLNTRLTCLFLLWREKVHGIQKKKAKKPSNTLCRKLPQILPFDIVENGKLCVIF